MKLIANKLEEMDKYFSTKNDSEKWGMIAITAGFYHFYSIQYFLPYAQDLLAESMKTKAKIRKKKQTN